MACLPARQRSQLSELTIVAAQSLGRPSATKSRPQPEGLRAAELFGRLCRSALPGRLATAWKGRPTWSRLPEVDRVEAEDELVVVRAGVEGSGGAADAVEPVVPQFGADGQVGGGGPVQAGGDLIEVAGES